MKTIISVFYVVLTILDLGLLPKLQAVSPAPDGGYPGGNTAEGQNALFSLTSGGYNTAVGYYSLRSNPTGQFNTAIGAGTLLANTGNENTATGTGALFRNTGFYNTANGAFALFSNTSSDQNTAVGTDALLNNTTGNSNTAIGADALLNNATGSFNIALGPFAGGDLTTGDYNIDIGNSGFGGEAATIRIGDDLNQTRTFIAAIYGVTTGGAAIPVLIDANDQLGTVSSSRRFKHDIKPMDKASEAILALKPVTFHYKSDNTGTPQFGLIAEEIAEVNSDLVVRDKNGEIYTVRYDVVNAMLLNEFLKEQGVR
jgi:hypothetical protein